MKSFKKQNKISTKNTIIFGIPGAGKSYYQKQKVEKICSSYRQNEQIVIIDVYGEYTDIVKKYNGTIVSLRKQIDFSPFININTDDPSNDLVMIEKVDMVVTFCELICKRPFDEHSKVELESEIFHLLKTKGTDFSLSKLYDQLKTRNSDPNFSILLKELEKYCLSDDRQVINGLNSNFTVYDLSNVPQVLFKAAYIGCLSDIMDDIRNNCEVGIETYVFMEDFTCTFANPRSADIMARFWKNFCTYDVKISAVCNDIKDLRFTYPGLKILMNTKFLILFKSYPDDYQLYQNLFVLSDRELKKIKKFETGVYRKKNMSKKAESKLMELYLR